MKSLLMIIAAAVLAMSCENSRSDILEWPWQEQDSEIQVPEQSDIWTDITSEFGTLPAYITVKKSSSELQGKTAVAYVAVVDMNSAHWDIWSINDPEMDGTSDEFKAPSEVYEDGDWPIVVNAGFFYTSGGKNYSSSLAVRNSEVLAYNINYASEDWVTIYNPTRAALLQSDKGTFDACWTYLSNQTGEHYMYPSPADNSWESKPQDVPSLEYPEGGQIFAAQTAIGGGPVLVNDGKFVDSYVAELFNGNSGIAPDSSQPRTAVGVTADNKMILFVCEGRQVTEGVAGLTTADVANVLLDLGCVEAINLDGGGSSCMLINGKETIRVSDGSQRRVGSTIMIK